MEPKINWIIHCVANGACGEGGFEDCMLPKTCNAHTHGMEQYGHLDFQLVLRFDFREVCRILNTLGLRVQAGEKFQSGDLVYGIYDDCQVRLDEYHETGRTLLRVVIPDKNNKFPEDSRCTDWYPLQLLSTEELMMGNKPLNIRLYQMKHNEQTRQYIFEDSLYVKKKNDDKIPFEQYEKVFDGKLKVNKPDDVFTLFNIGMKPNGYKGRSMSVSDIVEFEYGGELSIFYYCEPTGFSIVKIENKANKNLS